MSHLRNLRKRPFLVVNSFSVPAQGVATNRKGFMGVTGNMSTFERAIIVDQVNNNHMTSATVIIDILEAKVIKSRYDNDEKNVVDTYMIRFQKEVEQGMEIWNRNREAGQ